MMEEEKNTESVWKQALERRQTERLPFNFSYRMMQRVHVKAERQQKRKVRAGWLGLILSVVLLLGMGAYFLFFYLDVCFTNYFPAIDLRGDTFLFGFYGTIALLALILLGLDYWLRKKYIWK